MLFAHVLTYVFHKNMQPEVEFEDSI